MCACEPDFTCSKCKGTPFDPNYEDEAPISEEAFSSLTRPGGEPAIGWTDGA